ncbi:MAG: hypothetical protein ACI9R3_000850 [Verrucomicrobiales bacterium]|jgi:hypothetical protein
MFASLPPSRIYLGLSAWVRRVQQAGSGHLFDIGSTRLGTYRSWVFRDRHMHDRLQDCIGQRVVDSVAG